MPRRIGIAPAVVAGIVLAAFLRVAAAQVPSPDDTAHFLAGMPVSTGSVLQELAQESYSQKHASTFDATFDKLETQQLGKIRAWSGTYLNALQPTVFYFFSGPDFLYADAFVPNATTYVLSGLEAVGRVPDLTALPRDAVAHALNNIEASLSSLLLASYFITDKMDKDLNNGPVNGVLPLLYVFLARSGKVVRDVSFVNLDSNGNPQSSNGLGRKSAARGVKIVFTTGAGQSKTLYYFSADVADASSGNHALLQFCRRLGRGDGLLKSASYLLHENKFSKVRNFLLQYATAILQDDSGIPVASFDKTKWRLAAFGRYNRPSGIFERYHQPKLAELFQKQSLNPIDFGIGYQARFNGSNLLLATRAPTAVDRTRIDPKSAALH
jgi:hypothetical protein